MARTRYPTSDFCGKFSRDFAGVKMPRASDHIDMLLEMAKRTGRRSGTSAAYNVMSIRHTFQESRKLDVSTSYAMRSHFLVALVTHIEVFFRGAVTVLIDHGPPYIDRVDGLIKDLKFDVNSIRALQGREITLGEVISLVPSFQNLDRICSTMDALVDSSFMSGIATMYDRAEVEIFQKQKKLIIEDIDLVARVLSNLFKTRHIVVHELARLEPSLEEIEEFIDVTEKFLKASLWYVSELLDPGAPLHQQTMNARAGQQASDADVAMEAQYTKLRSLVDDDRQADLDVAQASWRAFRKATADFESNEYRGGTLRPLVYWTAYKGLTEQRFEFLKRAIYNIENDPRYN